MRKHQIEALAKDIYDFLIKYEMWMDVYIYFNGICWGTSNKEGNKFAYNGTPFIYEDDPKKYFEYVGDILSMSFEGPLYELLNWYIPNYPGSYKYYSKLDEEFRSIFDKYGLYFELGNAWNLTATEK